MGIMHPLLSTISLDSCTRIGDEGLMSVGKWCSALLSLTISNCRLVGSQGIAAVGAGCKKIKMLKLERINVSDDGLAHLGKYCEALLEDCESETLHGGRHHWPLHRCRLAAAEVSFHFYLYRHNKPVIAGDWKSMQRLEAVCLLLMSNGDT
jgi:hypothetical protein